MNLRLALVVCALAAAFPAEPAAAQSARLLNPPLQVDQDDKDIPEPKNREVSELYDLVRNMWMRHIDFGYTARRLAHRAALNVNAWDEVPDSSWFTGRIGRRAVTVQELLTGPPGLAPEPGRWQVLRLKTAGYTPGVRIHDSRGQLFILKFDLPDKPERNSAADRIGCLLMHAAGYYAPHNTVVYFRAEDLAVDEGSVFEDPVGRRRPMTRNDLDEQLSRIARRADGSYRGAASHFIPGTSKGAFPYAGTRKDDPNDLIPHELRRELRGFRVIGSWFNHVDVKEVNTYDTYVTENGRRFIRHYFIDFGSTMGSGDFVNGPCRVGHEYIFDGAAMGRSFVSLGAWKRPWEGCRIEHPEVGWFEADLFHPVRWKPNYPNLALVEMDDSDGYWGAKIVTAFTDDLVRALAEAGEYGRTEVTRYVEETLCRRRDKIGEYWFDGVTPLDAFELDAGREAWTLQFQDLGVERGCAVADERLYEFEIKDAFRSKHIGRGQSREVGRIRFDPIGDVQTAPADRWGRTPLAVVVLRSNRRDGNLALPVQVVIGYQERDPRPRVLGWAHAPR